MAKQPDGKRRPGRPTKLTPEISGKIVTAMKAGAYMETAAAYAGVAPNTVRAWVTRGEREEQRLAGFAEASENVAETPFVEFLQALKGAEADGEMADLATIAVHSKKQWQASAWRLERRFPQRYALRARLEHTGAEGGPIRSEMSLDLSKLTDEQLDQLERIAAAAADNPEPGSDPGGESST